MERVGDRRRPGGAIPYADGAESVDNEFQRDEGDPVFDDHRHVGNQFFSVYYQF